MFLPTAALLLFQFPLQPGMRYELSHSEFRGAVLDPSGSSVLAWGDGLHRISLTNGKADALTGRWFGEGGCLADLDGGGGPTLVLQEGRGLGRLVWLRAPDWTAHQMDTEVEMHDCLPATLFNRQGVLMVQRYQQVRFYEKPESAASADWPYREIYSIYTASRQGGLALADVNGDGRVDIFCGNYWIRSPAEFELPWRLFAINLWHAEPDAATMRFVVDGASLVVSQGETARGALARFRKPADPTQQWPVEPLADLAFPHGLAVGDFDGDGKPDVAVAENNGAKSRLLIFSAGRRLETPAGGPIHTLLVQDVDRDGRPNLIAVGPHSVATWTTHFRK